MTATEIKNKRLRVTQRPIPVPVRGEILIQVSAAGVNRPDLLQVQGLYPPPPGIIDIPGLEVAGVVVKGIGKIKKGQKVCALVAGGGYAEYCTVPVAQCLPVPRGLDFIEAASLPETFFTVWRNLFDIGKLKSGETVLIHGGTSGIGVAAIQMAKAFGATVITTSGSNAKCRFVRRLGADLAINYKSRDFVSVIQKFTKGKGVHLVLDMVGGDYVGRNLKCLMPKGRHVSIAMQKGQTAEIEIFRMMRNQLTLTGSVLRAQPISVKGAIARKLQKHIWPSLNKKKIIPVVDRVFDLKDAAKAHEYLKSGKHMGKVVLCIR